ncbi:MAG: hypothetical protein ACFFB5_24655 [Promethearchaeota archaeon]
MKREFNLVLLFLIISLLSSTFIFSTPKLKPISRTNNDKINPISSDPSFISVDKHIVSGTQDNPPFDDDNLRADDGSYDSTSFIEGDPDYAFKDTVSSAFVLPIPLTAIWGTNDGGPFVFSDAYKDKDGIYLYMWASFGFVLAGDLDEYPGYLTFYWGDYTNIGANIHPHVFEIQIDYGVMADTLPNIFINSQNLMLYAVADNGSAVATLIAANPVDGKYEEGTWIINSGPVFERVKEGGYIKRMALQMYCGEQILSYTWLNVDYLDIYYRYHVYDVFFYYDLDFSGDNLGSITQFDLTIDLEETVLFTGLYLWDYITTSWDFIDFVGPLTTFPKKFSITSEADHYIDGMDHMIVAISRFGYFDARPYTDYQIKVDLLRIDVPPPDPPQNVQIDQGIKHIFLTWDIPNSYGTPIIQYNVYRGITPGGSKSLLGTTTSNWFNDTEAGDHINEKFYYVISATSSLGEGENSTEVHGMAYDQPFVEWLSPDEGTTVIFPYNQTDISNEWIIFNFEYDWTELTDVELIIEGQNLGSVWGKNSVRLYPYNPSWEGGPINATLIGSTTMGGTTNDTREFTFLRTVLERVDKLDDGQDTIGQLLYLILHDPSGDESYSGFNETATLSIGVGYEITTLGAEDIELLLNMNFFELGSGGSPLLSENETEEEGFDFRFEVSDATSLTSNQESDDPDYIGPGYGDMYWGETWIFKWELNATWKVYSDATTAYEDPKIYYGIVRESETLVNKDSAPQNWIDQNPVYDNWEDVVWHDLLYCDEDKVYIDNYLVTNTLNQSQSFQFQIDQTVADDLEIGTNIINITELRKNYAETALAHSYETNYHIYDNEPGDWIVQEVGIDRRFGTYIFNTSSLCQTSQPYEHSTKDYVAPVIENPNIVYDSNEDSQAPCYDDSPYVTVDVSDEGEIQEVILMYSINNGTTWESVTLSEQAANPGTWGGSIPAQPENTTVSWYIVARDSYNNNQTRKDLNSGLPFTYKVVKKFEVISGIPGYSIIFILPITIVIIMALVVIYHKKTVKYKK